MHNNPISVHTADLPDDEQQEIFQAAGKARVKKRLPPSKIEEILVKICRGRWLGTRDLAHLLARNEHSLRNRFLVPMVERKILAFKYPETPNHKNQAYTSTEDQGSMLLP